MEDILRNLRKYRRMIAMLLALVCTVVLLSTVFADPVENDPNVESAVLHEKKYTSPSLHTYEFPAGTAYIGSYGLLYVPTEVNEETRCCVYFPGGGDVDMVWYPGVFEYLENYQPNAMIFFSYMSFFVEKDVHCRRTAEIMLAAAEEVGIELHDMITVGSSVGTYVAMRAAAIYYMEYGIPVSKVIHLDAGLDWILPASEMLSDEQCDAVVEAGTWMYLCEQPGTGLEVPEINRMVEKGIPVVVLECVHKGHDDISRYAYHTGLFSFGFDEIPLDTEEYTPVYFGAAETALQAAIQHLKLRMHSLQVK